MHENISDDQMCNKYSKLFTSIGKLKDYIAKLHINDTVTPAAIPRWRISFQLRKKVEAELTYLKENGIIEKVEGPTPWTSPIVTSPKPNNPQEVRICTDMKLPNTAIKQERHISPHLMT